MRWNGVEGGDLIPETILDSLVEDLERPHRRLVMVGGSHNQTYQVCDAREECRPIFVSLTVGSSES